MLRGAGQAWAPCRAVSSGSGSTLFSYFCFSYGACAVSHRGTRLIAIEGPLFTLTGEAHERAGRRKPCVERASSAVRLVSDSTTHLLHCSAWVPCLFCPRHHNFSFCKTGESSHVPTWITDEGAHPTPTPLPSQQPQLHASVGGSAGSLHRGFVNMSRC